MSPKTARSAGRKTVEKEMSDLGATRKFRIGLALKFMVPVTLAVSLVIILMGFMVYRTAAERLEQEIDKAGIFAAKLAAAPEIDSWDPDYNTTRDLVRRLGRIAAEVELGGGTSTLNDPLEGASPKTLERLGKYDLEQKRFNERRLSELISEAEGALDMLIVRRDEEGKTYIAASASRARNPEVIEERHYTVPASPGTIITVGKYRKGKGPFVPCRIYKHPIRDRKGRKVGTAWAVYSVEGLRAGLNDLRETIVFFCVLGILACAGVAYLTSKLITRPLKTLLRDIHAVASGDLSHRTRKHSDDEIGVLAQTFDQMTRNLQAAEEMRVDLADKEHQLQIAQELQERLFPRRLPTTGSLSFQAANWLAGELSSDLFDALPLEDGKIGCLVMTASGRGFPAAIILSMARSIFRACAGGYSSPKAALVAMNRTLSPDLRKGMYVSAVYAIVDPETGEGRLASAGHRVPALLYVSEKGGLRKLPGEGIALGLDTGPVFESALTEVRFQLAPGDRLVLATEGAFLLTDKSGVALGAETFFKGILRACKSGADAREMLQGFVNALGSEPGDHDITLVVLERRGGAAGDQVDE